MWFGRTTGLLHGKKPIGRPRRRWDFNMNLMKIGRDYVHRI